jgi:hypothetical protein
MMTAIAWWTCQQPTIVVITIMCNECVKNLQAHNESFDLLKKTS